MVERDYAKQPLTLAELETIFGDEDPPSLLKTRHAIYKEREFGKALPERDELFKLIQSEPNLLRRPITRKGAQVVIGFDKEKLTQMIKA